MKKVNLIIGLALVSAGLFFSSCSSNRLCPAYPPSPRDRAAIENENQHNSYDFIKFEQDAKL